MPILIGTATEMIAYAGNVDALRAMSLLVAIEEQRFGLLAGRTLDNAISFRNPFAVAYSGLEIGDEALAAKIGEWINSRLTTMRMQRLWAEAMLDRYHQVPDKEQWTKDPLVARIATEHSDSLQEAVTTFAELAQQKRRLR